MINDNKAFNLRVKAASRLKALPTVNTNAFVLDSNQTRITAKTDSDFNKTFKTLLTQASIKCNARGKLRKNLIKAEIRKK